MQRVNEVVTKLGRPYEGTKRVWVVLTNGTHAALTFCADCQVTPDTLPTIHRKMRESWAAEGTNEYRQKVGGSLLSVPEQWRIGAWNLRETDNVPLGVLFEETWEQAIVRGAT
jgi:hypothetical protein